MAVQRAGLTKWDGATLLQRVWGVDALKCDGCGKRMRFIAVIKDRAVIERILNHIGEDVQEPAWRWSRRVVPASRRERAQTRPSPPRPSQPPPAR
ncbi:MAG: hypothetical protein U0325_28710, partial [Polyangiales bacterium]